MVECRRGRRLEGVPEATGTTRTPTHVGCIIVMTDRSDAPRRAPSWRGGRTISGRNAAQASRLPMAPDDPAGSGGLRPNAPRS